MNAQERQLIDELFDRLSKLESAPRDADAEAAIRDGLRRAPNAAYALVQTVLVQDEALKRANAHIEELEAQLHPQAQSNGGGFLDSMRDALFGSQQNRGSVPNVRPQRHRNRIRHDRSGTAVRSMLKPIRATVDPAMATAHLTGRAHTVAAARSSAQQRLRQPA